MQSDHKHRHQFQSNHAAGFDVVLTGKDGMRVMSLLDTQHFDAVLMDVFM